MTSPRPTSDARESRTRKILRTARHLIEKPEDWTNSLDKTGGDCAPYCAGFAIMAAQGSNAGDSKAFEAFRHAVGLRPGGYVGGWNDRHTHAEVLAAFDKAIEAAP